jgi:hypothetical protein
MITFMWDVSKSPQFPQAVIFALTVARTLIAPVLSSGVSSWTKTLPVQRLLYTSLQGGISFTQASSAAVCHPFPRSYSSFKSTRDSRPDPNEMPATIASQLTSSLSGSNPSGNPCHWADFSTWFKQVLRHPTATLPMEPFDSLLSMA